MKAVPYVIEVILLDSQYISQSTRDKLFYSDISVASMDFFSYCQNVKTKLSILKTSNSFHHWSYSIL